MASHAHMVLIYGDFGVPFPHTWGEAGSPLGTVANLMVRLRDQFNVFQMEVRAGKLGLAGEPLDLDVVVEEGAKYHIIVKRVAGACLWACARGAAWRASGKVGGRG